MIVKLLSEQHLEFLSLKGGCLGSSEFTHVKMPHCWKSHATAHLVIYISFSGSVEQLFLFVKCSHALKQVLITK